MMHVVLKRFTWCPDRSGITSEDVVPGDERDFGEAADGLKAEGYIEPVKKTAAKPKPDTPADGGARS